MEELPKKAWVTSYRKKIFRKEKKLKIIPRKNITKTLNP